ncbi:MAG: MBL fold metallo-hydrolase [Elusimicrobiota bacterium]
MGMIKQNRAAESLRSLLAISGVCACLLFFLSAGGLAASAFDNLSTLSYADAPAVPSPSAPEPLPGPLRAPRALNAYFISVGQGDAEYLELPNGSNVLIDGGPNPTAPLVKFLTDHNITHIGHVVLTHPHLDHYSGLGYVFSHLQVDNFYDTREDNAGAAGAKALREKIAALGVNVVYPAAGDLLNWDPDEVAVKVLNTCSTPGSSTSGAVLNECSIVLKVTYQDTTILYTGDMQADQEANLITTYGAELKADVLKVAHHGSNTATSTAFLDMVKPKYAYIEVGAGNTFGFPSAVTLNDLQAAGVTVFRTDLGGTQEYVINGR